MISNQKRKTMGTFSIDALFRQAICSADTELEDAERGESHLRRIRPNK
jgi:hypothetical protein